MLDDNLHKTDAECTEILNYIFCDALSLYKKVAPNGWISSEYIHFLHPTTKQQIDENKLMTDRINKLMKKEKGKEEDHFKRDRPKV